MVKTWVLTGLLLCLGGELYAEEGFYKKEGIPLKPQNIRAFEKATAKLVIEHPDWLGIASAIGISQQGYYLTALHNIENEPELRSFLEVKKNQYAMWVKTKPLSEPVALNGVTLLNEGSSHTIEVVAWGKGRQAYVNYEKIMQDCPEGSENCYLDFYNQGLLGFTDDIALVRIQNPQAQNCIRLSSDKAEDSSRVWAAGFPGEAQREVGLMPDGDSLYFSYGSVIENLTEDWSLLVTTLDRNFGISGGGVVNEGGALVGVIVGGFGTQSENHYNDITDVVTPNLLMENLKEKDLDLYASATQCPEMG